MPISCDPSSLAQAARCFHSCSRGPIGQSIKSYLLCQWANANAGPVAPNAPSNIDISDASVFGNTIVTWTNSDVPTTNEIWKSVNGGAFAFYASVAGTIHTYTDVSAMAVNTHWEYEVRACNGVACSAFTASVGVSNDFSPATMSFPTLVLAYGSLNVTAAPDVALTMPLLRRVFASLVFAFCPNLASCSFPVLGSADAIFGNNCPNLASFSMPGGCVVATDFIVSTCPVLTTVNIAGMIFVDGGFSIDFNACAIAVGNSVAGTGVDGILRRCALSALTQATIDTSGGTSATPDATGQADKTQLVLNGCTVNTN